MKLTDILSRIMSLFGGRLPEVSAEQPAPSTEIPDHTGTFLIADAYPPDLDDPRTPQLDIPPFRKIVGAKVSGKEIVGCVIKASEGLSWGSKNENWFKKSWADLKAAGGDRYGNDWFRGCYHFLRFSIGGAKQADYFVDLIESAGGFDHGDLMPWVDVEEGGQGSWAGGQKLEEIRDVAKRTRLAREVTTCVEAFVKRFHERTGLRIAVYGRGVFRDLQMTSCQFGADSSVNPAYTSSMPQMTKYGVPLEHISLWQLVGDGFVACPGFPSEIPGWGKTDYSVYVDGPRRTTLRSLKERCLAKKP